LEKTLKLNRRKISLKEDGLPGERRFKARADLKYNVVQCISKPGPAVNLLNQKLREGE
jgi:hypothetical protein